MLGLLCSKKLHLPTLLPYPGSLAWPRTPCGARLVVESFRMFPQFDGVAGQFARLAFHLAPCLFEGSIRAAF